MFVRVKKYAEAVINRLCKTSITLYALILIQAGRLVITTAFQVHKAFQRDWRLVSQVQATCLHPVL